VELALVESPYLSAGVIFMTKSLLAMQVELQKGAI
jgi:hypothetical protein